MDERCYRVKAHYATYEHVEDVRAEDAEQAIAIVWRRLERRNLLTLPMAARSATATEIDDEKEA